MVVLVIFVVVTNKFWNVLIINRVNFYFCSLGIECCIFLVNSVSTKTRAEFPVFSHFLPQQHIQNRKLSTSLTYYTSETPLATRLRIGDEEFKESFWPF